ncbi:MAG TPA: GDCCVxC domain-containing (seleno)protein [Steroidobacteraceae bacterium]|jgi:hypothetical protein
MELPLVLESVLTCPHCGFAAAETMPTDACIYFYECKRCRAMLRPRPGDCCVFCSYGSVKCPPIQQERGCCSGSTTDER